MYAGATVQLSTTPFDDRLGPLRRREVDLVMTRLPLDQPDIVVGPVLNAADQRVVMLGRTHPLTGRADLSIEDPADHDVRKPQADCRTEWTWRKKAFQAGRAASPGGSEGSPTTGGSSAGFR
jgi:DNA-binding transcriptional LysR family regulator